MDFGIREPRFLRYLMIHDSRHCKNIKPDKGTTFSKIYTQHVFIAYRFYICFHEIPSLYLGFLKRNIGVIMNALTTRTVMLNSTERNRLRRFLEWFPSHNKKFLLASTQTGTNADRCNKNTVTYPEFA